MADQPTEQCPRKQTLLEDVKAAIAELIAIHDEEVAALLAEDFDGVANLKVKLQQARERKVNLIELYREHVISHGC